jgi:hypothetical protein
MGCCGQNRATLRSDYTAASPLPAKPAAQVTGITVAGTSGAIHIQYLNGGHVLVRGPRTGWQYEFSQAHPIQAVDPRDAESFIATGLFEAASKY